MLQTSVAKVRRSLRPHSPDRRHRTAEVRRGGPCLIAGDQSPRVCSESLDRGDLAETARERSATDMDT